MLCCFYSNKNTLFVLGTRSIFQQKAYSNKKHIGNKKHIPTRICFLFWIPIWPSKCGRPYRYPSLGEVTFLRFLIHVFRYSSSPWFRTDPSFSKFKLNCSIFKRFANELELAFFYRLELTFQTV